MIKLAVTANLSEITFVHHPKSTFFFIIPHRSPSWHNYTKLSTFPIKIYNSLKTLEHGESCIIYQLQSSHSPLNKFLHSIKKLDSPNCNTFNKEEDTKHYLLKWKKYNHQRTFFRQTINKEKIKIDVKSLRDILDLSKAFGALSTFILSTNRFKNLQSYKDQSLEEE
jgi:hypothetical protein